MMMMMMIMIGRMMLTQRYSTTSRYYNRLSHTEIYVFMSYISASTCISSINTFFTSSRVRDHSFTVPAFQKTIFHIQPLIWLCKQINLIRLFLLSAVINGEIKYH